LWGISKGYLLPKAAHKISPPTNPSHQFGPCRTSLLRVSICGYPEGVQSLTVSAEVEPMCLDILSDIRADSSNKLLLGLSCNWQLWQVTWNWLEAFSQYIHKTVHQVYSCCHPRTTLRHLPIGTHNKQTTRYKISTGYGSLTGVILNFYKYRS